VPVDARSAPTNPGPAARTTSTAGKTYTIKPGDTPAGIARKHGISVTSLMAANPGVRATALQPGHTLNIPGS
jgi:LysM repeat protein